MSRIHQFIAKTTKDKKPKVIPPGMKLWPDDDGIQPRDGSWGYVINSDGNKEHVHHGDWIRVDDLGIHAHVIKDNEK